MKTLVALCLLFIAYLHGCAKISANQRENDIDSQRSLKSNAGIIEPFPPKNYPSPSLDVESDQTFFKVADTEREPSSSPQERDNSQSTRPRIREDHARSTTKEEILAQIAPRLSRSGADLPVKYGSDGHVSIDLKGRFSHVSLAKKMPDGTIRHTCVNNIKAAKAWLSSGERPAKQ
jgi:hypothetical protein